MPIKHLNLWRKAYPDAMFVNVYGPTEITCNCTYYIVDREYELDETLPMGKAFPNERVFLLDDDDNIITESQPGTTGEVGYPAVSERCKCTLYLGFRNSSDNGLL